MALKQGLSPEFWCTTEDSGAPPEGGPDLQGRHTSPAGHFLFGPQQAGISASVSPSISGDNSTCFLGWEVSEGTLGACNDLSAAAFGNGTLSRSVGAVFPGAAAMWPTLGWQAPTATVALRATGRIFLAGQGRPPPSAHGPAGAPARPLPGGRSPSLTGDGDTCWGWCEPQGLSTRPLFLQTCGPIRPRRPALSPAKGQRSSGWRGKGAQNHGPCWGQEGWLGIGLGLG